MRTITKNVYRFEELSPAARDRAWLENNHRFEFPYHDEYKNTLKAFERAFDISVYDYRVGDCVYNPYFKYVTVGRASDASEIDDSLRLARYVWNNFADGIKRGKYYSRGRYIDGKYQYKFRYSRCTFEYYDLTGFCADYDILDPILDCLFYKRFFNSFEELIDECLTRFFRAWDADIDDFYSYEHFAEMCDINDIEFYETGELYHG